MILKVSKATTLNERLEGVEGFLHPDEPAFLAGLAAQVSVGQCIVEIGSYRGRSTIALAHGAQEGVLVYAVDPHEEHVVEGLPFGMTDNAAFMANVSRAGLGHKVRVINAPSGEAHRLARPCKWMPEYGLVFIDGAHDYPYVAADVRMWSGRIVDSGILALHDANTWDGPTRVADELAADTQWTEIEGCAYTRVFRKEAE